MADILVEIMNKLPDEVKISLCNFEGANIIVYTKSKDFFLDNKGKIRELVGEFKKRIELRPDPSMCLDMEKAKKIIEETIPEDAKLGDVLFDPQRSIVILEAEKPGVAIGKAGELLKIIKEKTLWVPTVRRTPSIKSKLIENIRGVLFENNDFRKKFLNDVGKRIYNGWIRGRKNEWVRLTFLGGGRQVGRSCLYLQTPESRILLDCGINVAASNEHAYPIFDCPEFKINEIDAVIVSHSHLDHCAMIPLLIKYGYQGPIYCTEPVRDIMALLALDYISVGYQEVKNPPFTAGDVKQMVKQTICLNYEEVSDITPDVRITLYNSGHTIGSSMVHLHIGNGLHNLLYTGDMNYEKTNLLPAAVTKFPRLETVIIESTYGSKQDILPSRKECEDQLAEIIKTTAKRGGKVLMPVLGVGRSQEIMVLLEREMREGKIPNIPIFLQGMVWDVNAIHTAYPDFFTPQVKRAIFHKDENPFLSEIFKHVGSRKEMEEVIHSGEPCIIMATSGMMVGGASVEYFKNLGENPKNSLVLTCYQGEGSLGRRLQNGEKEIGYAMGGGKSFVVKVNCDIHTIQGFSGHSSRPQLMSFLHRLDPKPKRIIVNHGENSKCLDLSSSAHKALRVETNAPRNLDALRLK
ncbi:beta-CASP ribonuclease aCPSF1 [archaeon]|nr:beta-CASP ribonuclease aCPSF1 [archaeon]